MAQESGTRYALGRNACMDRAWPIAEENSLSFDVHVEGVRGDEGTAKCTTVRRQQPEVLAPISRPMRVLVACEFSGVVRDAFIRAGHDAYSCDLLPPEGVDFRYRHLQCDVRRIIGNRWDLMIAHPPCTHLAVSGARWFAGKRKEQAEALDFVRALLDAPIERIALENPVSIISSKIRKPDQIIQPWQFGHGETKATCLWLKNLPPLQPTQIVEGRAPRVHFASPGPDRWKERSRTLAGIAKAMASQWGSLLGRGSGEA